MPSPRQRCWNPQRTCLQAPSLQADSHELRNADEKSKLQHHISSCPRLVTSGGVPSLDYPNEATCQEPTESKWWLGLGSPLPTWHWHVQNRLSSHFPWHHMERSKTHNETHPTLLQNKTQARAGTKTKRKSQAGPLSGRHQELYGLYNRAPRTMTSMGNATVSPTRLRRSLQETVDTSLSIM